MGRVGEEGWDLGLAEEGRGTDSAGGGRGLSYESCRLRMRTGI